MGKSGMSEMPAADDIGMSVMSESHDGGPERLSNTTKAYTGGKASWATANAMAAQRALSGQGKGGPVKGGKMPGVDGAGQIVDRLCANGGKRLNARAR